MTPGVKVAYATAPTATLSALAADIRAKEGIEALNVNRARSWYWAYGVDEANLDKYIAITKLVGAEVLFVGAFPPPHRRLPT